MKTQMRRRGFLGTLVASCVALIGIRPKLCDARIPYAFLVPEWDGEGFHPGVEALYDDGTRQLISYHQYKKALYNPPYPNEGVMQVMSNLQFQSAHRYRLEVLPDGNQCVSQFNEVTGQWDAVRLIPSNVWVESSMEVVSFARRFWTGTFAFLLCFCGSLSAAELPFNKGYHVPFTVGENVQTVELSMAKPGSIVALDTTVGVAKLGKNEFETTIQSKFILVEGDANQQRVGQRYSTAGDVTGIQSFRQQGALRIQGGGEQSAATVEKCVITGVDTSKLKRKQKVPLTGYWKVVRYDKGRGFVLEPYTPPKK